MTDEEWAVWEAASEGKPIATRLLDAMRRERPEQYEQQHVEYNGYPPEFYTLDLEAETPYLAGALIDLYTMLREMLDGERPFDGDLKERLRQVDLGADEVRRLIQEASHEP